jgi:tripartite-type tricarboxylate transporter receptor subunit TctC
LLALADAPAVAGHIKAGRIRVLAHTAGEPMREYPGVPSMLQAGVPDLDLRLWSGLFAPAATPDAIVERLAREVTQIVDLADVRERLVGLSVDPGGSTRAAFAAQIAAEIPRWTRVAKAANIRLD